MQHSQFDLFKTRRFLPLFITQFFGAFNDNLLKNAVVVLINFHGMQLLGLAPELMIQLAAGLFILPFFLFSATSGQLCEKYDKARVARLVKVLEIAIMLIAAVGFWLNSGIILMSTIFLMGIHSTLFGPLKFSVLPQYLQPRELVGGNGLIEMGTFVSIIIGQVAGTLLINADQSRLAIISALLLCAVIGYLASRQMPPAPSAIPELKVDWNFARQTWGMIAHAKRSRPVWLSLLGISWFWFLGAVYLSKLPTYASDVLHGDETVYTLLMTLFSFGVGLGSMLCERLSGQKVELGLVPFGSIGLCLFGIDLYFATPAYSAVQLTWSTFLHSPANWRLMADFLLIGTFGGLYIVPLYALMQSRSAPEFRSRAIAANNIMNSLFMVVSAIFAAALAHFGVSIPHVLLIAALLNLVVAAYIYTLLPEFLMRFLVWIATHTLYRIKPEGLSNIPEEGGCVLICNHVSFMDALILAGAVRRPVRFVMDHRIFKIPVLSFIFRTAGAIPIAPAKENAALKAKAYDRVAEYLQAGEVVCIFPEGGITRDGEIQPFRPGIEDIIRRTPVPVLPMALQGLWGSFFSRKDGAAMMKLPRGVWSRIGLRTGLPVPAADANKDVLEAQVRALRGDWR
ncbi:Lysophospholipid transporter LplT [Andreprevotia sp. IGB-42]|uniref:MFS transporter n=1 Tax=Andreprevotia sp. IGB-42 TaxID=2497473 RepID=UPI00135AEC04|nr:MFS transporter [Andreprevotia sp. IGB-42]KAF0814990.1 Lysophospholipid transporter LplT [Andreprevotia sp. IGB-42]